MKTKSLTILAFAFVFQSCTTASGDSGPKEDNSVVVYEEKEKPVSEQTDSVTDSSVSVEIAGEEINQNEINDGIEIATDAAQNIIEATNEIRETKRRNDSIRLSRREKMYAYQLGVPFRSKRLLLQAYENLSDKEGVIALKKGIREYLLVKYEDKHESELDSELDSELEDYKAQHGSEVIGEIKKIDLVRECGKRKKPQLSSKVKNTELDCLICK